mgnify:CR=1 FL=1
MKILWVIPCLALCACMNNNKSADDSYVMDSYQETQYQSATYQDPYQQNGGYQDAGYQNAPAYEAPVASVPATSTQTTNANPYAMDPPVYEQETNLALTQKEQELFQKEKNLLDGQQELYEREKKLADREAAFISRSKALDYKEQNIMAGRSYAPTAPVEYAMPAAPVAVPTPVPARVYYADPTPVPVPVVAPTPVAAPATAPMPATMPVATPTPAYAPVAARPLTNSIETDFTVSEEVIDFNAASTPAKYEADKSGFIIMQHPIQRDLIRCPVTDDVCLESYERLGYVRSSNLSRFTAQDELNTAGTYPANTAGQWRENNSVPRW